MLVLTTNHEERAAPGTVLYAADRPLLIETSRPHQGRWIVHFAGVESRTAAEELRGTFLTADRLDPTPDADELWVHELVGSLVRDRSGADLGRVVAVEANPAHDLLVLDGGGLVPMVFVVEHVAGVVTVDPPAGLLDA
jgi:16S rRNA processing protein RimM